MTGYKGEEALLAEAARHAAEFRMTHGVFLAEWELAEAMTDELGTRLHREFWEIYDGRDTA